MASNTSLSEVLLYHFQQNRPLIPMYLHLLFSALLPIFTGAHASLSRPSSAAKRSSERHDQDDFADEEEEEEEDDDGKRMEGLSNSDAIIFPLTAGLVLASLYFLIKKFGADMINLVLGVYFSLVGVYSVGKMVNDSWTIIESFISPTYYVDQGKLWKVKNSERRVVTAESHRENSVSRTNPLAGPIARMKLPKAVLDLLWNARDLTKKRFKVKGYLKDYFDFSIVLTRHNAMSAVIGAAAIAYSFFVDKPWWLTNLQGFAVSYGALQLMSPTTFGTGTLILSGLFFYDIWAVFFTPLMVTVAKNLDVPIKMVFPRPDEPGAPGEPPVKSFSMLGLGDIVLPGLMIAFALRFDLYLFYLRKQKIASTNDGENDKQLILAPYIQQGHIGERFWTRTVLPSAATHISLPEALTNDFAKTYFTATMVGYVVGMLATLVFMSVFQHPQPALLYLVPGVLISLWGTGLIRGEVREMWHYSEAITMEQTCNQSSSEKADEKDKEDVRTFLQELREMIFGSDPSSTTPPDSKGGKDDDDKTIKETRKEAKQPGPDDGAIFSFTISNHKHRLQPATGADGTTLFEKDSHAHSNTTSISDDTVVVSSSDLEEPDFRQRNVRH